MKQILKGFKVEVDVERDIWHSIVSQFEDANLYQTWDYNAIRSGINNISNIVLKREHVVVAAAQVRIFKAPLIKTGIAYVYWGPLWHAAGIEPDPIIFIQAIRALRNEYVYGRGLALRLVPPLFRDGSEKYFAILDDEGFLFNEKGNESRSLILDLSPSLGELRKGFEQKWRNCLNQAERNAIELIEGDSDELFLEFIDIYRQLVKRKKFEEPNNINEFQTMQEALPENQKLRIILCRIESNTVAGAIFSTIGKTGVYIYGATVEPGMKSKASYLIQWKFIEWLKINEYKFYNLNGINPINNPGTYRFKAGLCKTHGRDVIYLGQFNSYVNSLQPLIIDFAENIVGRYKLAMRSIAQYYYSVGKT